MAVAYYHPSSPACVLTQEARRAIVDTIAKGLSEQVVAGIRYRVYPPQSDGWRQISILLVLPRPI